MSDTLDALRAKCAKQRQEIGRLTREVERLKADKSALRFDLAKERAANGQVRDALIEAQSRWEALYAAKSALSGIPQPGEAQRASTGEKTRVQ